MGKSSKKSATKVGAAPAVITPSKALKKGKRETGDGLEAQVSLKKQKKAVNAAVVEEKAEKKVPKKVENNSPSDSEEEQEEPALEKNTEAATNGKEDESSDEESADDEEPMAAADEDESEDEKESDDDDDDEDDDDDDESEDEKPTPKKKNADVKMGDAEKKSNGKQAKTPAAETQGGSKTLFVGNLSYQVEKSDIESFFKEAGEVTDVRLAMGDDNSFRGYGHVEFASSEDAQKAMELNGQALLGREVRLDLARERGAPPPNGGGRGGGQSLTVFVKGFDASSGEDEIRSALKEHFSCCGEISRISVPTDRETGNVKGIAYMDVKDSGAVAKALELNGSEMEGSCLTVDEAKPRGDGFGGGRGGGRGGRGGRFGGRGGGGGRRGGGGGRRGGGRGGGRGNRF